MRDRVRRVAAAVAAGARQQQNHNGLQQGFFAPVHSHLKKGQEHVVPVASLYSYGLALTHTFPASGFPGLGAGTGLHGSDDLRAQLRLRQDGELQGLHSDGGGGGGPLQAAPAGQRQQVCVCVCVGVCVHACVRVCVCMRV